MWTAGPVLAKQRGPGRPRSQASHDAILDATMEILVETGYHALTLQKIAERAGVGRQTLYRWWGSKADIVLEAFSRRTAQDIPPPDTGRAGSDLVQLMVESGEVLKNISGPIVLGLLAEAALDEEFAAKFWKHFQSQRRAVLKNILARGIGRGELPSDLDLEFWADLFFGGLLYRLVGRWAPIDRSFGEELAKLLPGNSPDVPGTSVMRKN
jgi:AcrR family transcriptional regulator